MTVQRKKKLQDLHNRIDIITELRKLSNGTPTKWRGKLVIPVAKWESMFSGNMRRALEYIPNGYTNYYEKDGLIKHIFGSLNPVELQIWKEGYLAFLEHVANPVRGRILCQGCLLQPSDDTFGLRKIIANALITSGQLKKLVIKSSQSQSGDGPVTDSDHDHDHGGGVQPCAIHNRFMCPYRSAGPTSNDNFLIGVGQAIEIVEAALSYASEFNEEFEERFDVDFDNDAVEIISMHPYTGTIKDLTIPKAINVTRITEIFNSLKNPELLNKLLDQYLSHEKPQSNLNTSKDRLVKFVMGYRDKIKMEDLCDAQGLTLEDSEQEYRSIKEISRFNAWPSAKCFVCNTDICQIHCSKCNVFMCRNHWREHMVQRHPALVKKYPPEF